MEMTGFAIAKYLIVVLEVFLICDVSARGLKPEMVERKESLIYLCASVGMNVFFRCLGKAGVSATEIFIFKSGILALLLWAVRRVSIWRAFLVFGCFQILEELSRTWIVLLFCIGAEYADVGMVSILALNISRIMLCILVLRICEWQKSHEIEVNWMLVSLLFLIGSSAVFYFQNVLLGSSSKIVFKSSIWAMVVFLGILCMIYLIYHDMKQKEEILQMRVDMAEHQYEELAMEYEKNRRLYHDMNNHNLVMWKLAEKGEYERLHKYIGKLRPLEKDRHRQWTQNLILDMILEYKLLAMEKKKILYEIKTDMIGEIALADKELCILLGNLLDNAIEACEKLEEEKRMVKIEVRKHHSMFMLIVENSCEAHAQVRKGIFRTTKKDDRMHGYGIHNVRKTVKNHGGQFQYGSRGENFYVKILIPLVI